MNTVWIPDVTQSKNSKILPNKDMNGPLPARLVVNEPRLITFENPETIQLMIGGECSTVCAYGAPSTAPATMELSNVEHKKAADCLAHECKIYFAGDSHIR